MKGKKLGVILAALAAVIVLVVVAVFAMGGNNDKDKDNSKEPNKNTEQSTQDTEETEEPQIVELDDATLEGDYLLDFANGPNSAVVFESDGWSNGDVFNVVWTKNNVKYADGKMYLGITKENKTAWINNEEVTFPYTAGEARTQNYFGYGEYFVKMKPSANPGTASTFFTCTGPYDSKYVLDENGAVVLNEDGTIKMEQNPHDEIDIEFLGKDTTKVQFNFFVNGKGGNEYMYDLGFDASKEFHEYGFRWTEDSITWFIDGKPVYKVTTDKTVKEAANVRIVEVLPKTPGRLLMNYWCGNEDAEGWMGKYEGNVNDNGCVYQWIKASTKGAPLNPENVDLSAADNCLVINGENYLFEGADYTFKALNDNKALNVTYKNIVGATYKNIATGLVDLPSKYNKLSMKVKNNGKQAVKIRIDVQSQTQVSANTKACNVYATQDGNEVYTDKDWGGSQFEIAAGKTSTLEIYFDASKKTEALIIYIDSADYLEDGKGIKHSGDVTFSNVAFGSGKVPVAQAPTPVVPDAPEANATRVEANLTYESNDIYTVTKDETNKTWNVTYTAAPGESYRTISAAVEAIDAGLNRYTVKVKNNGTEEVKVRIDIIGKTAMGTTPGNTDLMACNLAALQDGEAANTDLQWGGSTFTIAAGQTSVLEVIFDASKGVNKVEFFFDTHVYQDGGNTHAGNVTLSEMAFVGVLEGENDGPIVSPGTGNEGDEGGEGITPEQPETPVSGDLTTTINGTEVTIAGNTADGYGVNTDDENNKVNIVYTNILGSSYKNINIGGIGALAAEKDTFKIEITNNGTETVKIRIDIQNVDGEKCNVSAMQTGVSAPTDNDNGTQVEIAPAATAIVEIKYDATKEPATVFFFIDSWKWDDSTTHAGDITLSGMEFKSSTEGGDDDEQGGTQEPETPAVTYDKLKFEWKNDAVTSSVDVWGTEFDTIDMSYTGSGPNWEAVAGLLVSGDVAGKHKFSVDVTNNGEEAVKVRFDLKDASDSVINVSQTATNDAYAVLDTGSCVNVEAGQTVRLTITTSADIAKILVFPGSAGRPMDPWDGAVDSDITLSNFKFEGTEPEVPVVTYDKLKFEWKDAAVVSSVDVWGTEFDSIDMGYTSSGPNWSAMAGLLPATDVAGKHTFSVDVTNNGEEAVKVRFDLKDASDSVINVSQTATNDAYAVLDTGSCVNVEAGQTVRLTITTSADIAKILVFPGSAGRPMDPWDGEVDSDITLSNFKFEE